MREDAQSEDGEVGSVITGAFMEENCIILGACAVAVSTDVDLNPRNTAKQLNAGYNSDIK